MGHSRWVEAKNIPSELTESSSPKLPRVRCPRLRVWLRIVQRVTVARIGGMLSASDWGGHSVGRIEFTSWHVARANAVDDPWAHHVSIGSKRLFVRVPPVVEPWR
jgi:hypothetical protein